MRTLTILATAILALSPPNCRADVADSGDNGFTIKSTFLVKAKPAEVYQGLVNHVGDWWSAQHTFSRDPHNLTIDAKPMGCFCEKLPNGGGVRHMEVLYVAPDKGLVMSGGLGPFQALAVVGTLSIALSATADGTKLEMTYAVGGYLPNSFQNFRGFASLAKTADSMLQDTFTRLKNYVEHGSPEAAK